MAQTIITSPFTENRMVISVTHTSHGFDSGDLGKPMRSSGVNGRFVVAQADSATNAEVVGVLTSVEDVNNYTITSTGIVDAAAAIPDAATAGQVLFVSQTADTVLTTTEPTAVGQVSKPVAVIIEQNAKMLLIHYRGEVITSTTQTNAPNDATYVTTTSNSSLSNEVLASALKIDDFAAGDDNTDLDSSAARHGLLRKLDGTTTNFLRGDGAWAAASSTPTSTWIPTHAMRSTTAESVNHWDYAALYMDATNTDTICVSGVFAATPTAVKWIIMPTLASGSIVYTLTSDYAAVGQTLQTHQDSTGNTTLPTTNNTLQALDVMISPNNFFGSAVAGDFFGMIFSRIGGNGNDTLNATLAVIGLLVEY